MNAMELIESAASIVWRLSWQAAALVLVVLLIQRVFRGRLAPAWRHALWFLVLTRLLLPVSWESGFSVYNLMPRTAQSEFRPPHFAMMDGSSEALRSMPFEIENESTPSPVEPDLIPTHQQSSPSVSAPVHHAETVPVVEAPVSAERWTWQQALAMMWLGGLLLMSARLAGGYLWFASRLRRDGQVEDPEVLEMFQQCRELMRVRTRVRLQETGAVETPGLFGLIRLRLLLPAGLAGRLSRAELRHVFLHELAHVRRRDVLVNWLVAALQAVHWFNPILWFAFHRLRADREVACDALVLARTGAVDRRHYGRTILRLLESCARPRSVTGVVGILEDRQQLKGRMRMIARFNGARRSLGLGSLLAVVLAVTGLTDARTQEPEPKETGAGVTPEAEPAHPPVDPGSTGQADETDPVDAPTVSPARQRIMAKLDTFILPEVEFKGVPLGEVIRILDEMAVTIDPDQKGVNFIVNHHHAPRNSEGEPVDLMEGNIHLTPPLKNVRLRDVLDAIVKTAESPIRYTIQEYGIVFTWPDPSARSDAGSPPLFSRTFNVDPVFSTPSLPWMLREYLSAAGADFPAPGKDVSNGKSVFFNDRLGKVFVRSTMQDIEIVERVIQNLGKPRKRVGVELEVKIIAISPSAFEELPILRAPGDRTTDGPTDEPEAGKPQVGHQEGEEESPVNGIESPWNRDSFADPEFLEAIRSLERSGKARTLSDHRVITPSGRVTRFIAEGHPAGDLGMDVNAYDLADGLPLELKLTPVSEKILLISDLAKMIPIHTRRNPPAVAWTRGESMTVVMKRDSGTVILVGATMADDQTGEENLMLMGELPLVGRFFKIRNRTPTRSYLFLIKGSVIESAVDPVKQ